MLAAVSSLEKPEGPITAIRSLSRIFKRSITSVCNPAMPPVNHIRRNEVHSWTAEFAEVRGACLLARRRFSTAHRKRSSDVEWVKLLVAEYGVERAETPHSEC